MLYLPCVMLSCSHINVSYFVIRRWILTVGSPPLNAEVDDEDNPILITSKMAQIRNRTTILLLSTWWLNRSKKLRQFKGHTYYYYWHPLFHLIGSIRIQFRYSLDIFFSFIYFFALHSTFGDLFLVDIHKTTLRFAIRRFAWGAWGDLMVNNWKYTYRRWRCSIFRLGWRQRAILENRSLQMWMTMMLIMMIEACQISPRHMFHLKWRWSDKHSNFHWIRENLI